MASEQSFLEAISADPDDDAVRLIFADWLEEQGDPARNARGEFIRVQLELEHLPDDDPRRPDLLREEQELRSRHERAWLGPLRPLAVESLGTLKRAGVLRPRGIDEIWARFLHEPESPAWSRAFTLVALGSYLERNGLA